MTCWTKLAALVGRRRTVALATVVGTYRSAPRQPGASMLVGPDGEAVGSVSGGCVEGAVYELGEQVRADGRPVLQRYGVSDDDAFAVGPDLRRHHRRVRREGRPGDVPAARRGRRGDREGAAGRRRHGRLRPARAPRHAGWSSGRTGSTAAPARPAWTTRVRDDVRGLLDAGRNAHAALRRRRAAPRRGPATSSSSRSPRRRG